MKRPLALIPFILLAAAVVADALWYLGDQRAPSSVENVSTGQVMLGGPFSLIDQNQMPRTDKDFQGKYMLVFFGYTYCPDVCPTTLAAMAAALDKMGAGAEKIVPVFITVDPKRDTPEKIKSYLSSFGPRFVGLTGEPEAIAAVAKEYSVYYKEHPAENGGEYTVDHSGVIYLMGPDGKYVANYSLETTPDTMAAELTKHVR